MPLIKWHMLLELERLALHQRNSVDGATSTPRSYILSARSRYEIPYLQYHRTQTRTISTGNDGA